MTQLQGRSPLDQVTYDDLYARWERGNWRATEIDFSQDREDWYGKLSDVQRRSALWTYAMFFHGEDSVTDNLSPYIDAAPREEQKYFLATQQVDEARHAVFFGRFMREVVERGDSIAGALDATRPELTWGFRKVFERLDRMADELRRDRSRPKFAAAITLYHLLIEATLAQPGQHYIESFLEESGYLPGFHSGMKNVSLDEQRHIGFGVKVLSELIAEDPDCREASLALLREVLPYSLGVFVPPNWDRSYVECFGSTLEDIYAEGTNSMWTKLRTAGFSEEEISHTLRLPAELSPRERAERALALLKANIVGEKVGPPSRNPEVMALLFESMRLAVDLRHSPPRPVTIQWDFADADPWFLQIDNGATSAEQGRREDADLTFRCRFEDWVDVAAGRDDPRLAMLRGKIRPKGSLRLLWRSGRMFAR
jgi:hypothetical protein